MTLKTFFKRWVLWHSRCPIHGVEHTEMVLDPDASWDAGLLTWCRACKDYVYRIKRV